MLGLVGFLVGSLTTWLGMKMLKWGEEGEKQIEKVIKDREIE